MRKSTSDTFSSHHQAKKFKLNEGYSSVDDYEECRWGVCDTRRSLGRLHRYLLDACLRARIPVVGVAPFDFLISDRFELNEANYAPLFERLEYLLAQGFVPMLHGDVLLDRTKHWRIFSGDDLLLKLAEHFQPRLCAFLTSVPGVLRSDGSVMEEFAVDQIQFDQLESPLTSIDVTGSMQNKVQIASDIVRQVPRCQVFILQGVSDNAQLLLSKTLLQRLEDPEFCLRGSTRILKATKL